MNALSVVMLIILFMTVLGMVSYWLWRRQVRKRSKEKLPDHGHKTASMIDFYVRGNQLGFSLGELRALHGLARRFHIADPNNMLLSQIHLDRCLRQILHSGAQSGLLNQDESVHLLAKVFEYRMGIEKNRPRYRKGLDSTRMIETGQVLKLLMPGKGVFQVKVIENFRSSITVEKPSGNGVPVGHKWRDQRFDVYFWRKGDALYYFESFVLNDPDQSSLQPVLQLSHSENLVRTQKRNAIRVKVMKMGSLLPVGDRTMLDELWDPGIGFQCKVTDISLTGAAVLVRGKVQAGRLVKLQVELGGLPIVMCGEIKGATLNALYNVSLLHIEAMPPLSSKMSIRVHAYVLGLVTDEAPVQVAENGEEAADSQREIAEGSAGAALDSLPGPEEAGVEPAPPIDLVGMTRQPEPPGGRIIPVGPLPQLDSENLFGDPQKRRPPPA